MYMHLYHVLVRNHYNGISDGFQIRLKIHLRLDIKHLVQHNNKLSAVTEFDLSAGLGLKRRLTGAAV